MKAKTYTLAHRVKINFMIESHLSMELKQYIPEGERSDFVNEALEEALLHFKRIKAFEEMDKLREEANLKMTDEEIIRLKNAGRK